MWIRRLEVADCAGIAQASVSLEPGLNVLYGPNELGKSTLVQAVRSALLLPASSTEAERLRAWSVDGPPTVELTFEQEARRIWRVRKRFVKGGGSTYLEFSQDGETFSQDGKGKGVDGSLQDILRWGVKPPGGKGGKRGMPSSLITTALLGDQSAIEAILDASLGGDQDDSGRDRLNEALQALAEDPRFKQVLAAVQERVDEAFTQTGRRSSGRASPWTKLRAERSAAEQGEQDIRQRVEESEAARERVRELSEQLLEADAEAEQTAAALKAAQEQEVATQALDEAEKRLRQATRHVRGFEQKQAAVEATQKESDALREAHAAAERVVAEAEPRAKEARDRVLQLASGDAEQGRQIRLQEAQNKRLHLQQKLTDLAGSVQRAQALAASEAAVVAKAADIERRTKALTDQRKLLAEARSATATDKERLVELARERDCVRYRNAVAKAEKCKADLTAIAKHMAAATALAAQAEAKRAEAKALQAPAEAELKRLRQLDEDHRVAQAKLAVGLAVEFTPERAGQAELTINGETRQRRYAAGERLAYHAERELRLTLDGIGTIEVRGGGRDRQREAQAAADRWQTEAAPIFARAGLDAIEGLDALEAKAEHAASLTAEAAKLDSEATQERLRGDGVDAAEHAVAIANAETEQSRLAIAKWQEAGVSLDEVLSRCDDARSEAVVAEEVDALQQQVSERDALCIKLATEVELEDKALATAKAQLASDQQALSDSMPQDEDWRRLLAEGESEQQKLADDLQAQDAVIDAIQAEATAEAEQAKAEQTQLETELATKRKERDDLAERLQAKQTQLALLQGEAKALEAGAKELDINALQAVRDDRLARLEALPATDPDLSPDPTEKIEHEAKDAQAAAASTRRELAAAQGALSQVGGQAIEEQAAAAREALATLDRREHELEVDYGAWKLLRETLTDAEKEDAAHLGDALVKPVSERMNKLTNGRYEAVGIGPQLDATGVRLGGDERDFGEVSVGTREQIALLLRLSIAEALESFLILDDHLTQSDPKRMAWIRNLLGEAAKNIQVVVMTCHPNAYITGAEHAVDLTQCITRHGVGA